MIGSRLIKSNDVAAGCEDIVDNYDPFDGNGVALYQLNGNANDVSGNYNGTATNVTYGAGQFGQAGVFNGSSSYINTNFTVPAISSYSSSLWFKTSTTGARKTLISDDSNPSNSNNIRLILGLRETDKFVFVLGNGSSAWADVTSVNALPYLDNNWHNAVLVIIGTSVKLYIDGSLVGNLTSSVSAGTAGTVPLIIGAGANGTDGFFNGSIDQVRLFNTALDPLEVEALYTEELCICDGTVDTLDILGDGSCIATYQLDGNANDLSGNYSGTPTDVSYEVGEFDLAGVFNGSSSGIDLPSLTNSYPFTVSAWINTSYFPSPTFAPIVQQNIAGQRITIGATSVWNPNQIAIAFGGTSQFSTDANSITSNQWTQITACFRASTDFDFYINGSPANVTNNGGNHGGTATNAIGYNGVSTEWFDGSIDQVRIFNKALNSTEVTTLYNETACTKAACTGTTNTLDILGDGSCVAAYPLDGTPADLSGNYNGVQTDVTYPQGYFDLAGSFGIASRIETSLHFDGTTAQGASLSAWFKGSPDNSFYIAQAKTLNSSGTFLGYIVIGNSTGDYTDESVMVVSRGSSTLAFVVREGHNAYLDNQWHHIVVTSTSTSKNIYIDGQNKAVVLKDGSASTNLEYKDLMIHSDSAFGGSGSIDQVRIFNKAISASEVTTLYNETPCN